MAAKIDKDALKKHGFWIGLGGFFLLWLVALIIVLATNQRKAREKEFEEAKKKIDGELAKGVKSEESDPEKNHFTKEWVKYGRTFSKHKDVIWREAWVAQAGMYTWPGEDGTGVKIVRPHHVDKLMTTSPPPAPLPDGASEEDKARRENWEVSRRKADTAMREKYRNEGYLDQFAGLEGSVFPAKFDGGFASVFPIQLWNMERRPTTEEIILAQEDFVVRREMLDIVRNALDSVRELKEITDDPRLKRDPKDTGPVKQRLFRNGSWELHLIFKPAATGTRWVISDESKIKNVTTTGNTLPLVDLTNNRGLPFRISQTSDPLNAHTWRIGGEPLAPGAERNLKEESFGQPDLKKPIRIHQYLFYEISPIRRIDVLALGSHSHRTVTAGLKLNEELKKLEPVVEGEAAAGDTAAPGEGGAGKAGAAAGGPPPGMGMGRGGMGEGGMGGMGGPGGELAAGEGTTVNKIPRKRYMHVTPQTRHLPVALRFLVDQAHVNDVLTSVSNSRLRIQVTQVQMQHVADADASSGSGSISGGRPGAPGLGGLGTSGKGLTGGGARGRMPGGYGVAPPRGMMQGQGKGGPPAGLYSGKESGGMRGTGGGGMAPPQGLGNYFSSRPPVGGEGGGGGTAREGGAAETTSQFKDTARLVELSIYGIASLYEPFKPGATAATEEKKP